MNQVFTMPHVTGYVNVLITHRLSLFENPVAGRITAVNGTAVWTYKAEEMQIEKVEYVNMRPTIAGFGAGCVSAWVGMHAIQISQR
ncbi:hypothetical protein [Collinsella sp. LCP19S3_B11]|uniref:hypothetical protein n=1 Tax=Collinsella sp. LCP19S3_B11 TaxID=3438754 RepID=UPI003F92F0D2